MHDTPLGSVSALDLGRGWTGEAGGQRGEGKEEKRGWGVRWGRGPAGGCAIGACENKTNGFSVIIAFTIKTDAHSFPALHAHSVTPQHGQTGQ